MAAFKRFIIAFLILLLPGDWAAGLAVAVMILHCRVEPYVQLEFFTSVYVNSYIGLNPGKKFVRTQRFLWENYYFAYQKEPAESELEQNFLLCANSFLGKTKSHLEESVSKRFIVRRSSLVQAIFFLCIQLSEEIKDSLSRYRFSFIICFLNLLELYNTAILYYGKLANVNFFALG